MSTRSGFAGEKAVAMLIEISRNLWWTWHPRVQSIFRELSPLLWEQSSHNPVALLSAMSRAELRARLGERELAEKVARAHKEFTAYLRQGRTWASTHAKKLRAPVAYFSAEFGFHESLRTYSGGLGILAGDHTKSASDMGVPFIGVSLFYRQGYFEQRLNPDGWQLEEYIPADPSLLPVRIVVDKDGEPVRCSVEIGGTTVFFHTWQLDVGRSTVYLLDTNLKGNEERFRDLTAHVYGGDTTTRISQEIILGIGGIRLLRKLNIHPAVYHLNEGHSAFLTLELLREQRAKSDDLGRAAEAVRKKCVFTTHTPVPAGHDRFSHELMGFAFESFAKDLGVSIDDLMDYGRVQKGNAQETFCMTVLALRMTRAANGVSRLHGEVSREMWKGLYPGKPSAGVPIGAVTNGVHVGGWLTETTDKFWRRKIGEDWERHLLEPAFWQKAVKPENLSDEEIWSLRYQLRRSLIEFVRRQFRLRYGRAGEQAPVLDGILNPDALTIGFSRRFATYKRAPLLFTNLDRAIALFNDPDRPVQMIFAGKAHPRDDEGKKFIRRIFELTKHPMLAGKVVFLENYDISVARHLVSGADLWLNNPRRPLEASGTSGQKVAIHGGLNCSILDGWWREGFDGTNGWAIGKDGPPASPESQDQEDAELLFTVIQNEVVPEFFDRDAAGIPKAWLRRVRRAMATLIPQYNTHRMVADYVTGYYLT